MKYLKIENDKGHFLKGEQWLELDQIGKEDLLALLDRVIEDEFEMDAFDANSLHNKAHQIIYKQLYKKFDELKTNKNRFKDECDQLYKNAIEKYTAVMEQEENVPF